MRFSLATLLLFVLFAASLMALWVRREPWTWSSTDRIDRTFFSGIALKSPDGTRILDDTDRTRIIVTDISNERPLSVFQDITAVVAEFDDDDTISIYQFKAMVFDWTRTIFRRRFPEWWWGHFYRPEVWISIALGLTLIARIWRTRQRSVVHS